MPTDVAHSCCFNIGHRSSIVPIRLCPLVLAVVAVLLVLGNVL